MYLGVSLGHVLRLCRAIAVVQALEHNGSAEFVTRTKREAAQQWLRIDLAFLKRV